jgi:hypothetical protein
MQNVEVGHEIDVKVREIPDTGGSTICGDVHDEPLNDAMLP